MITRRRSLLFLIALGLNGFLVKRSADAAAPSGKTLRIGLLYAIREKFEPESNPIDRALVESLRAYGYEMGRNVILEFRSAAGNFERTRESAAARKWESFGMNLGASASSTNRLSNQLII